MKLIFSQNAWHDYLYCRWQCEDQKDLNRINFLIHEIVRQPFKGPGRPQPLRHGLFGYWSRRLSSEHRIIYKVKGDAVHIAQLRYHY